MSAAGRWAQFKHLGGFLVSGVLAYATDVGVTKLAMLATGWSPVASRLVGIAAAMLVAWLAHRRLTFAVTVPPSLAEFARYTAAAWSTAVLNYSVFVGVVWLRPGIDPSLGIAASSLVAMVYSYLAMRFGVFVRR